MHRRMLPVLIAVTALVLGLGATPAHAATAATSQRDHASAVADLVDLHNTTRRSHGLSQLKFAPTISREVSQSWTMEMSSSNNLAHNSDYSWPGANRRAENVAYTSSRNSTAHLMRMWLDSPGHRKNMLNDSYDTIAIGVVEHNGVTWATANFYAGPLRSPGTLHGSGAAWLSTLDASGAPGTVDVYTTPGTHHVNGRDWRTECEPYSRTKRCTTEIRATQVTRSNGRFVSTSGWVFNNMTYLPSARSLWDGNNLGRDARWTSGGRRWRTECDTAVTGRNGCRSYIWSSVVVATKTSGSYRYSMKDEWVFNNIVQFS